MPLSVVVSHLLQHEAEETLDYLLLVAYCELHDCLRKDCHCDVVRFLDRHYSSKGPPRREWRYSGMKVIE